MVSLVITMKPEEQGLALIQEMFAVSALGSWLGQEEQFVILPRGQGVTVHSNSLSYSFIPLHFAPFFMLRGFILWVPMGLLSI